MKRPRCRERFGFAFMVLIAVVSACCEIGNYPVIFDTRGGASGTVEIVGMYDEAYIVPSFQVATIWNDGSDSTNSQVTQNWNGDQVINNYCNFDPTASLFFLDDTYCDPTR